MKEREKSRNEIEQCMLQISEGNKKDSSVEESKKMIIIDEKYQISGNKRIWQRYKFYCCMIWDRIWAYIMKISKNFEVELKICCFQSMEFFTSASVGDIL